MKFINKKVDSWAQCDICDGRFHQTSLKIDIDMDEFFWFACLRVMYLRFFSQWEFTCSKSTVETLGQGVKFIQT